MVNFQAQNDQQDLSGKEALIVGGTQGIGAATAERFGSLGANVAIAGRNEQKGNEILERIRAMRKILSKEPDLKFFPVDASSVEDVKRFTKEVEAYYASRHKKLDYLIQTQGGPPNGQFEMTSDNLDKSFMTSAISRWLVPYLLLSHGTVNSTARCIAIGGPGQGGPLDFDDVSLLKYASSFGNGITSKIGVDTARKMLAMAQRDASFNDAMTLELAKRFPSVGFYHMFPGVVNTNAAVNTNQHWILQKAMQVTAPIIATEPRKFADRPVYVATATEFVSRSPEFLGHTAKSIKGSKWAMNDENRQKLWEWATKATNVKSKY